MLKKSKMINKIKGLRHFSTELNLDACKRILEDINNIRLEHLDDDSLKRLSFDIMKEVRNGTPAELLLAKAYALAREATGRVLGIKHFDVQVIAGIAMHHGALVEMQTGEGKTLSAVLPAYFNALSGKGVHILTFNDYLAQRDATWMGPIYEFLGLSVGFIREGMSHADRRKAYSCNITYLTAKEAGFDYLKSFLCTSVSEFIQRPFNFAIIDEADSILIDEARIPLVIAGKTERKSGVELSKITEIVRSLDPQLDYNLDEFERNVFLSDKGTNLVEKALGCGNLYSDENLGLLVDINNALHAQILLKRDVDYIVRDGKIELVDEFTGRVADKRQWPHGLQEALEAKESITTSTKGQIITSITLQNFIKQYPRICGMTGTVKPADEEFMELYGLSTAVIPTNKKCIRIDYPDVVFTHWEAKLNAVVAEIAQVHQSGRPVLIGTRSVDESEQLAQKLNQIGVSCYVLNAKNDDEEAKIIANAGSMGAVTVSTNMAGRGTDIKLGGEYEKERDKVIELGGLYVIGTNKHESRRIDNQLRGRAGRQGDPGCSRFFVSLEDDLMKQYRLKDLIPEALYPKNQDSALEDHVICKKVDRAQITIERQNYEIRRTLNKYAILMERQRQMIYNLRTGILTGTLVPTLMKEKLPERYTKLLPLVGEQALIKAQRQVLLHYINVCWADYLDFLSYTRETIHLTNMAGKIPVSEFNKISIEAFGRLMEDINDESAAVLANAVITEDGIDMDKAGLKSPSSTWTYMIDDNPEQLGIKSIPISYDPLSVMLLGVSMTLQLVRKFGLNKTKHLD